MDMLERLFQLLFSEQGEKLGVTLAKGILFAALLIFLFDFIRSHTKKTPGLHAAPKGKGHGLVAGLDKRGREIFVPETSDWHAAVFAATGDGKTSAVAVPTLQTWQGTGLVPDISGDIESRVRNPHKLVVRILEDDSVPYNIFAPVDACGTIGEKNEALEQLALQRMPEPPIMDDNARYFLQEGRKILLAALIAFYHQGMEYVEICKTIKYSSWRELFRRIDATGNVEAKALINAFEGGNERNIAGAFETCVAAVDVFTRERLQKTIRRPKPGETAFTADSVEDHLCFVQIPERYAPVMQMVFAQTLHYISARPAEKKTPLLLLIDEFVSMCKGGKFDLAPTLRKSRKKRCHVMILTQSVNDIDMYYGESERKSMMNNFTHTIIMSAHDPQTQRWVSDMIGEQIINRRSVSTNYRQVTRTRSEQKESIINPADIGRMRNDLMLLYPGGYLKLKRNYVFKNPKRKIALKKD